MYIKHNRERQTREREREKEEIKIIHFSSNGQRVKKQTNKQTNKQKTKREIFEKQVKEKKETEEVVNMNTRKKRIENLYNKK